MRKTLLLLLALITLASCRHGETELNTLFERSQFLETDDYEGTIAYAKTLAKRFKEVNIEVIGQSGEGRDLVMLIVDEKGLRNPKKIRKNGKDILLVQSCIHPGEPHGKDAMFLLIKNMLLEGIHRDLLKDFSILFVPVVSPDGLANFSPFNRINQNGPKNMGWRVTAQGLNLNRDYTKLESPEISALVQVFNLWQPDLFFDTHATDGADYQYVTTYSIEDFGNYDPKISQWMSRVWEPEITQAMQQYNMPITRYIEFHPWGDPNGILYDESYSAMLSESYASARNCAGVLLETHMLKPYKERVLSSYNMIVETMKIVQRHKAEFDQAIAQAKVDDTKLEQLPINMVANVKDTLWVDFLGYCFDTLKSEITGGNYYAYDTTKPETRRTMKFRCDLSQKSLSVPQAYVIPVQYGQVIDIVKAHGFKVETLKKAKTMKVSTYRFKDVQFSARPSEGRQRVQRFEIEEISKEVNYPKGSVLVKTNQNGVRLLMNLLEPEMRGSLLEWGYFNTIFQRNEYFEIYKMEPMAQEMLAADPLLKIQFDEWKKSQDYKAGQYEILNWFYERSPYYDKSYCLYPIGIIR